MEFKKAVLDDLTEIDKIRRDSLVAYKKDGLNWDENYPNKDILQKDILNKELYKMVNGDDIVAIVVLNEEEDSNYKYGNWITRDKSLVVHRLMVSPKWGGQGYGKKIFKFIEEEGRKRGLASIKLDTHVDNIRAQGLYQAMEFVKCGIIKLEERDNKVYLYEKIL